ncbi:30S ribosomal protein S10, chloroplastic-like [Salvia hispanica]|uniref:30S ribosomal protein S10, chloroplastic-like n=1 Tax=Salvia hispanica TaxID=49212 RepID=UPI002009B709|nr:30S ribosomal protein S10, chloroplastic-like [Salvia hispanica]
MASIPSNLAIPVCNSSIISSRPQVSVYCSYPSNFMAMKPSRITSSRILAAPQVLESNAASTATEVAPKQKIRIKLRSYWVPLIEDSCKQIMEAARTTNAKTMGPVPLPTKRRVYCVLKFLTCTKMRGSILKLELISDSLTSFTQLRNN